ncbi:MAG: transglutaminase TgpA family protein [Chloroflexota bacterium]
MRSITESTTQHSWLTLLFLVLVQLSAVRAVQDAGWLTHPSILLWVSLAALLTGAFLARLRAPAELLHLAGLLSGIVVLGLAGASTLAKGGLYDRLANIAQRIAKWVEVTSGGGIGTDNLLFLLFLAALAWLIGYVGAFAIYRYHQAWLLIVPTGAALVITASYAEGAGGYFFLFAPAAILLFIEVHANRRESNWRRAGIQQARSVRGNFLRQGVAATLVVVAGSTWAPGVVSGAEFMGLWQTVDRPWLEMQGEFARLFGPVNAPGGVPGSSSYGSTLALQSSVALSDQPVMEVRATEPRRLRGVIYDRYTGQGWLTQERQRLDVPANGTGLESASNDQRRVEFEQRIRMLRTKGDLLFAASLPRIVSLPVRADLETLSPGQGSADTAPIYTDLGSIRAAVGPYRGQEYAIKSAVSVATANELRESSSDYSQRFFQRYTALPRNLPREVRALARSLTAEFDNPYDKAIAIQDYLRTYTYTLAPSLPPLGEDIVEYFLFQSKEGYCDYFSSSMVVMLRSIGIPARVVAGYLPGEWDEERQAFLVRESDSHSWPEVYFSGYGWVEFEPTASAPAVVHPDVEQGEQMWGDTAGGVDPAAETSLFEDIEMMPELPADGAGVTAEGGGVIDWSFLPYVAGALLSLLAAMRVAYYFWERSFRQLVPAEAAYAKMSILGHMFGRGPRAHETPFEYSRQLARSVPVGQRPIETIANAFVRRRFSSVQQGGEEGSQLGEAWRRLRLSLPKGLLAQSVRRLWLLLPRRRVPRP